MGLCALAKIYENQSVNIHSVDIAFQAKLEKKTPSFSTMICQAAPNSLCTQADEVEKFNLGH